MYNTSLIFNFGVMNVLILHFYVLIIKKNDFIFNFNIVSGRDVNPVSTFERSKLKIIFNSMGSNKK